MNPLLPILLIFFASHCCSAVEPEKFSDDPYATGTKCEQWQAKWIWSEKSRKDGWPVIYARKTFDLKSMPESAVIHVSAYLYFKLYVNGHFVSDGPPRNLAPNISYSSFEVKPLLQAGTNVIVVEAYSSQPERTGGLVAQLECRDASGAVTSRIVTDESWRVTPAPWERIDAYSAGYNIKPEIFDAKREPTARHESGFDDSKWEKAFLLPEKQLPYKILEPSILPHYRRTILKPAKIEFTGEAVEMLGGTRLSAALVMVTEIPRPLKHCRIANINGLLADGTGPAVIENEFAVNDMKSFYNYWDTHNDMPVIRNATVILDFGELVNGYVSLDLEGNEGAIVDIAWGQTLLDGRVPPVLYARTGSDAEGKPNSLHANRYFLREGRQQWETFQWQSFRYLQLTFRQLERPLKLYEVAAIRSGQPMTERGQFHCADPLLEKLFVSTGKTLRDASYDTFMDNTIREKVIWGGDISDGSVGSCIPVFGDPPMLQYYMNLFCKAQAKDGALPERIGGDHGPAIAHPIRTAIWMAEYGLWCGDTEHYRSVMLPALERYLDYLKARSDSRGLLTLNKEIDWVDHVTGRKNSDIPTPVNLLHVALLDRAARTFEAYGKPDQAAVYRARAEQIKESVRRDFWVADQGLYTDGLLKGSPCGSVSEHANYLALYCGLGDGGRQAEILKSLRDPDRVGSIIQVGPPFMIWPLAALFKVGEDKAALDMMRSRYARFFVDGGDTFWEGWSWLIWRNGWQSSYRSFAQNGAGSPAWFLLTEVLGVKPLKPGFAEFEIDPKPGGLKWAEGVVPSPAGDIPVRWEQKKDLFEVSVTVPQGTQARVRLPLGKSYLVDGKEPKETSQTGGQCTVTLEPGQHRCESIALGK